MPQPQLREVHPANTLRRIGHSVEPLKPHVTHPDDLDSPQWGGRWDSERRNYGVLYFGSSWPCSYGETLQALRPTAEMISCVPEDVAAQGFMLTGTLPASWRHHRTAVSVKITDPRPFIDVEDTGTHQVLTANMAKVLAKLGIGRLDVSVVRSDDRRVTRAISQWIHDREDGHGNRLYAGVRYLSKINTQWECWAVFEDVAWEESETRRTISPDDPGLVEIRELYGILGYY